jgi:hypothetical protein
MGRDVFEETDTSNRGPQFQKRKSEIRHPVDDLKTALFELGEIFEMRKTGYFYYRYFKFLQLAGSSSSPLFSNF